MADPKSYKIHFVCHGNTFRSRLAAAYFHKISPEFEISSSGIWAKKADSEIVEPFAAAVARRENLIYQIKRRRQPTTDSLLKNADIIIFLNDDIYEEVKSSYRFDARKVIVWHIADIDDGLKAKILKDGSDEVMARAAAPIYKKIERDCEILMKYLNVEWTDVVDENNDFTGLKLPITLVTDKGLWHRGCHVVVRTSDGRFVVGKRTNNIIFAPGMLEISVGGSLEPGETPIEAAQRETAEELGARLPEKSFKPLFTYRQNSYHPRYRKRTRAIIEVYALTLPEGYEKNLKPQPDEVAELRVVDRRKVKQLLTRHRLKHFGRLRWGYKFFQKAVFASESITP